jgi:acid phosphatase class B
VEFNIDDIDLSEDEGRLQGKEKDEKLEDFFETQSFLNEIEKEIDQIQYEINNAHEE